MYGLAIIHKIGLKGDEGVAYYRVGAALGDLRSMNNLGIWIGDWDASNRLWRKAAERGIVQSAFNLAVSYTIGRGTQKNEREAARWMKLAADQHYTNAMFNFAIMLRDGIGVDKDLAAAEELCIKAAENQLKGLQGSKRPDKKQAWKQAEQVNSKLNNTLAE
jgi:TPR repeat protein